MDPGDVVPPGLPPGALDEKADPADSFRGLPSSDLGGLALPDHQKHFKKKAPRMSTDPGAPPPPAGASTVEMRARASLFTGALVSKKNVFTDDERGSDVSSLQAPRMSTNPGATGHQRRAPRMSTDPGAPQPPSSLPPEFDGENVYDLEASAGAVFLPLSFCIVREPLYTLYMHLTSHQPFFYSQRTSNPYIPTIITLCQLVRTCANFVIFVLLV
jgi:hypothetical protein